VTTIGYAIPQMMAIGTLSGSIQQRAIRVGEPGFAWFTSQNRQAQAS
jgi:hypothetical protein